MAAHDKPVKKILDIFADERITIQDMTYLPRLVMLNSNVTINNKIAAFCEEFLADRETYGN